jgi:hypothetical protein
MAPDSRVDTVVHNMVVVLNTVGGRSMVGHSTVSLGTVSPDTEEDTAVLGEPTEEPHRRVEWAWVVRWRWEVVLSSVVHCLGQRLE